MLCRESGLLTGLAHGKKRLLNLMGSGVFPKRYMQVLTANTSEGDHIWTWGPPCNEVEMRSSWRRVGPQSDTMSVLTRGERPRATRGEGGHVAKETGVGATQLQAREGPD